MTDRITLKLWEPVQAYREITGAWPYIKAKLMAGQRLVMEIRPETRTAEQNRRYWGRGVLAQISEQAKVGGRKYSAEAWHEQFKRQFLGVVELPSGQVVGKSSANLTKAEFSRFCEEVEAFAASELGVHFIDLQQHE